MKKLLLAFICLQTVFTFGQAPAIQWQKSLGGTSSEICRFMEYTADGGYIMAGYSSSTNGDVTGNQGGQDYWIVKLDASGNITWQKTYGGTGGVEQATSIQQTTDGGYIVAGYSNGTNGDITGNHGDYDYWVIKLDANGNLIWQKALGGTSSDQPSSIRQTADGGYIVAGYSASTDGDLAGRSPGNTDDYWIVKLDMNGNISWQKTYGGTLEDWARSIQQTSDGGYIVAGRTNSTNGDVTGNHGSRDGWIVKLNATGNIVWQKAYGGTAGDEFHSIQQTTDGGYVVVGQSSSSDGDITENKGGVDSWIVKLDVNGNITWQKTYGGTGAESFRSIQQTTDGNYIVVGNSSSANGDLSENKGMADAWILKLDLSGNIIWQKTYGGTAEEAIFSVHQTTDGNYILGGYSGSTNGDVTGNHGGYDYWIVKLSDCSPVTSTITETACSSFTWTAGNGQTYTSSTTATHTIPNGAVNGCDSTVTLNLIINQPTSSTINVTNCGAYTLNGQTYSTSGTYTQTLTNINNCDSTITLNLTINQPTSHTITETACESYTLNAQTYTSSGAYTQTLQNVNNCDSTITLNLTINQPTTHTITETACGSYTLNTQTYTASGTYTQILSNANNCDSTITLNLTINNVDNTVSLSGITLTANQTGATYQWIDCDNGNAPITGETAHYFEPTTNGNYAVIVTNNGCTGISNCVAVNWVGIDENTTTDLQIFPNPSKGTFTIKGESLNNNTTIKVVNALGQESHPETTVSNGIINIDLTNEAPGVYLLTINDGTSSKVVQLIKQQ